MPTAMKNAKNDDCIFDHSEEHRVRESADNRASYLTVHAGMSQRVFSYALNDIVDGSQEDLSKTGFARFVPFMCFE
jgi:hypothetical protein